MGLSKQDLMLEEKKLTDTINEIDEQISSAGESLNLDEEQLKAFQKMMWSNKQEFDDQEMNVFLEENEVKVMQLERRAKHLRVLNSVRNKPYFGSIVFDDEPIYIGITSVKRDMDYLVYDWRSPICSLFYDFGVGYAKYAAPGGIEEGFISQKRQYKIENAKLTNVFDTTVAVDDEMLQDVLAENSSDKMKNIVNTIQAEQNEVIRNVKDKNIIVQGIAGSGKTSVALHRIAFLLYRLEHLTSGNVLIFSPNNVFAEYISEVLPDLGEENTMQTTYHEFASTFISEYYRVEPYSSFVERYYKGNRQDNNLIEYKLSDQFALDIEAFVKYFTKAARFIKSFEYKEKVIPFEELNELLHDRYNNKPLFERVELIAEKINNTYFTGKPKDEISILSKLYKCSNFQKDYKAIYKAFFETVIFNNSYKFDYRRNENIRNLNEKVLNYEDASPFIYLKCLLEGFPYQVAMRQVVIDEAQDYTYLQYKILRKIFKNASFTILGDVNQTVNPFYRYESLNILLNIFEDGRYMELNKTYRSSPEIISYANSILGLNHVSAIRRDNHLPIIKERMEELSHIGKAVKYLKQKYKSICIITKSIDEARIIAEGLRPNYPKISVIDIETQMFNKQLVVAPAYGVKGLEFDSVIIINNFSNDKYLYYVAVTRAQHELIVYEKTTK